MTNLKKSGFFKSLFGSRKAPHRGVIPLHIPLTLKMEKDAEKNVEAMWNEVMQLRQGPLLLLQSTNRYLEKINPLPLIYEQRSRISNIVLNEVVASIDSLFSHFFKRGGGIPETREQRETISQSVRAVDHLCINYKLLFRQDWADPEQTRMIQERTLVNVLRIFECTRLVQLLLAFRYQKLPAYAWRDINQLFFALRDDWDLKAKYPLKIQWSVEDTVSRVELFPKTANLEQLYLAVQLTGLLDVTSWPVKLAYRVGSYLRAIEEPFIKDDKVLDDIPAGHCLVYYDQASPPRFNRNPDHLGAPLLIDLNPIMRRATEDRLASMSTTQTSSVSAVLREIPERDRITFLDLLLHRVQPQQRHEARKRIFSAQHARVYGGFDIVYRLYNDADRKGPDQNAVDEDRRFWDTLAEHINIVADNKDGANEPRWVVSDEGSGGVLLHVKEGEYSLPIYVGRLVAYNSGEGVQVKNRLGYVVRLQRIGDDEVEVAIANIDGEIQPVMVLDQDGPEEQSLPALMLHTKDGNLRLLCDSKHSLITGSRVSLIFGGGHQSSALGKVISAQADFSIFALHKSV